MTGAALLAALAIPAVGQVSANAATTDLYVNNAAGAHCTNSGTGTQAAPFCTVQAAADVSLPGQTVHISRGDYPQKLKLTRSGTADAPITFVHTTVDRDDSDDRVSIGNPDAPTPENGLLVAGAQHIRVQNLSITGTLEPILFDHATDVSVTRANTWGGYEGTAAVRVSTGSSKVTIAGSQLGGSDGPGVLVDEGATGTVVSTNQVDTRIVALGSPGTVVVGNTVQSHCNDGITLAGASTDAVVENNVIDTGDTADYPTKPCKEGDSDTGLTISAAAASTAKVDYNVISPTSGGPAYDWAGTTYKDRAAFTTATGQGTHDFVADPTMPYDGKSPQIAPWVDSADENAPGVIDLDAWGWPTLDDPVVPNTGTGSGFHDRGAMEFQNFGGVYTPAGPTRVLDTREGVGTGGVKAPVHTGSSVDLQLAGVAGLPATGVQAVTLNVTVAKPSSGGFLTVFPHGAQRPTASNLNWTPGTTIANLVTVPVVDGKVSFYAGGTAGAVDVIADLAGYYSAKGSVFTSAGPSRVLDTRDGTGTGGVKAPVAQGGAVDLQVAGVKGVPAQGVTAVTLNVTVTNPVGGGFLTVYPHGQERPTASNVNWTPGTTIANLVTVPVIDGKVSFYAGGPTGSVDVIADVAGYYSAKGYNTYRPVGPWRIMDTRSDQYEEGELIRKAGTVAPGATLTLSALPVPATSVVLNVTVTQPAAGGFLTAYPAGAQRPLASNINWTPGQTIPNQVVVPVGANGKVSFYNGSKGAVHLVIDVFGYQAL
ncbi:right-handed parallel beta-helix repeat-containing protein [Streptomyces sp. SID13666]|uniref:right-handed parallel beta-helix repeat-containing protein n=1 Tax=unclassified Streptomyces TaxID=2593676 RepID=UPI0013C17BD9|nr:right-handed parallel beta-helix repeat-containing protein [Streptomyces sp. SID13666]NEA72146.1 right-handed parallel beta-helix repeat-containing protein [Streptomyces sp. SID13588]